MFMKMIRASIIVLVTFSFVTLSVVTVDGESCRTTGRNCIRSCDGIDDGNYQSCHSCSVYATCTAGLIQDDRPCNPNTLKWDESTGRCEYNSSTCHCIPYTTTATTVRTHKPTTTTRTRPTRHTETTSEKMTSSEHHTGTATETPLTTKASDAESTHLAHLTRRNCAFGILVLTLILLVI